MKRILICISDYRQGGIPRCLQTLLMNIDTSKCSIDLLCLSKDGPYNGQMPNCNILDNDYIISQLMVHTKKITLKKFVKYLVSIGLKICRTLINKITKSDLLINRLHHVGKNIGTYDCAIAYAEGFPSIVIESVKSENKLLWIHNDYAFDGARGASSITNFDCFNKICCVSKATQESFVNRYPNLLNKTITIYNLVNVDFIVNKSLEINNDKFFDTSLFTIISIGRVCAQKRFNIIPEIAKQIKDNGILFKWYIIGGGPIEEVGLVKQMINKYAVENEVIMIGERYNPYHYLRKSDLFVLTSLYESYPTVINEARILGVPIVTVDIKPALEMLGKDEAEIVPVEKIADAIIGLYNNPHRYNILKTTKFKNHNEQILNYFYQLVGVN